MIEIKNLFFSYEQSGLKVPIFNDFSLTVNEGDFIAIKGPSGSGKSTLLYLIAGLLHLHEGSISFKGKDISKMTNYELALFRNKDISFIFQQFHLLSKSNVFENISLPTVYPVEELKENKNLKEKINQITKTLNIKDRLDHLPSQLSGGQQQRVAIARALINNPEIILADEPTGNLDSKSTIQIVDILKKLNAQGKTIILITHEDDVAREASKIFHLKDGKLISDTKQPFASTKENHKEQLMSFNRSKSYKSYLKLLPLVWKSAFQNKARSLLTMVGIMVGVAAVCSMITLGNFTKEKILKSYASLGVNTVVFRGYPNWNLKATDQVPTKFNFFDWENELIPLKRIFPQIKKLSPNLTSWNSTVSYAGKSIEKEPKLIGISEDGLSILNRHLIAGRSFSQFHIDQKHSVCVIGYEIGKRLFSATSAIGQIIHITQNSSSFACKVIGILESKTSNKEWQKPNYQVFIPFTTFQIVSEHWWYSQIKEVTLNLKEGSDAEIVGKAIRNLFENKYGKSGRFRVDSDSILVSQMKKFLNLFSILLTAIAIITLTVGGIGIANMMLVSVSERFKEIGIKKSIGATNISIRYQFLLESILLCSIAGFVGILLGIGTYQVAIWGASKLIQKLEFSWIIDWSAILFSLISILAVGIISGLVPAFKAEKLQVIDALRSD